MYTKKEIAIQISKRRCTLGSYKGDVAGGKCEGNSSCTNNQLLVFIIHIFFPIQYFLREAYL